MGRVKQPREVAELKGAVAHDPQRYRMEPAKSDYEMGLPPDHLTEGAKGVWFELSTYAAKGVLTGGDRMLMELTSVLMDKFRTSPNDFPSAQIGHLISCFARMGLTPSDRQKIGFEKVKEANPFESF